MDIKIKKEYEYSYNEEENEKIINKKNSDNDILFFPRYSENNDCKHCHEQYYEEYKIDNYCEKGFSRNCRLTIINEEGMYMTFLLNITPSKVKIYIDSAVDSYIHVLASITIDRDLFEEEEKKYYSLKNNINLKILFNMILDKIEHVNSFTNQYNLLVESLKSETDKDIVTKNIRAFIDNVTNKSKSIGLKDKDIYVSISTKEIKFVYDSSLIYNYSPEIVNRFKVIQEEFNSIKLNVPAIQVFEIQPDYEIVPFTQIFLPELDSIVEISKIPISDNVTSYKISINDTLFSITHINCTEDDNMEKIDIVATREIYKKIVVVGNKLHLEDIMDIYNYYNKHYETNNSNGQYISSVTTISKYHKVNDTLKLYYEYKINEYWKRNIKKRQTISNISLIVTYLNSNQDFVHKKYTITDMTECEGTEPIPDIENHNKDIFFETNDISSCIKNRRIIISRYIKDNIATEKLTIEDTLR